MADDNVSYAIEFVTSVIGASNTTKTLGEITDYFVNLAKEGKITEGQLKQLQKSMAGLAAAIQAVGGPAVGARAVMRAMGKDVKGLNDGIKAVVSSAARLKDLKAADIAAQSIKTLDVSFKDLRATVQNSLDSLREFGRTANSLTALRNVAGVNALELPLVDPNGNRAQVALLRQQIELTQKLGEERKRAIEVQNATPYNGAGRLTNGTSGALLDEQNRLDALGRAAASDAIRKQMEGRGSSTASSGALFDSQIADQQRAVTQASNAIRQSMEENAAVAARTAEEMAQSQRGTIDSIETTAKELRALQTAYEEAGRAALAGNNGDLAKQYQKQAEAVRGLVTELEGAAKASGIVSRERAVVPNISGASTIVAEGSKGSVAKAAEEIRALQTADLGAVAANRVLTHSLSTVRDGAKQTTAQVTAFSEAQRLANARKSTIGNFYPLIVAAGLFAGLSRSMLGFAGTSVKAAADYEQAFASVARTTSTNGHDAAVQIEHIRQSLIDLSTQIPVTFQDLSKVATAGNQLGIVASNIPQFTKVVSEFAAVTGNSAEDTAKSFGSLIQILHLAPTAYNDLASSVTLVGRKSVATESEVLAMTTKIGAIAHAAGFSAQETVGLAAAFSSLREPVERSQGALTTYTKVVDKAAGAGGEKFQKFADVLHVTSDEAQKLLRTDPYQFFQKFLTGLKQLDGIGQTNTLGDLGLGNIRVSEVLSRLANNLDVVKSTQADAAQGYKTGSDLSTQYAKATDTLAAKFKELQNAMSNLFATLGGSGFAQELAGIVSFLKDIVVNLNTFFQARAPLADIVVGFTAMVGVLALMRGAMIAAAIAAYALENAELRVGATQTIGNFRTIANLMLGLGSATKVATVESKGMAVGQEVLQQKVEATSTSLKAAGLAARFFGSAVVQAVAVGAALTAITSLISAVQQHQDDLNSSFQNSDLSSALAKDTAAWEGGSSAIQTYAQSTTVAQTSVEPWVASLKKAIGVEAELTAKMQRHTDVLKNQTVAYGANARAAVQKALADNTGLQDVFADDSKFKFTSKSGFKFDKFITAILGDPKKGGAAYIDKVEKAMNDKAAGGNTFDNAYLGPATGELEKYREVANAFAGQLDDQIKKQALANAVTNASGGAANNAANAHFTLTNVLKSEAGASARAAALAALTGAQMSAQVTSIFAGVNAYFAQSQALEQLGQDYLNNGSAAAFAGQGMQSYINSVVNSGQPASAAANQLQELVNAMVAGGYVSGAFGKELQYLNAVISGLGGSSDTKKGDISYFIKGLAEAQQSAATGSSRMETAAQRAADALDKQAAAAQTAADHAHDLAQKAQDAASAFRTTADYANDLGTVLQRAFDIQFAPQAASDAITTAFDGLRKNATDATAKIKDARLQIQGINTDIAKLRSDNLQQNYLLGIANAFGDSIGAASIQAQIAQNKQDIASKQASKTDQYKNLNDAFSQLDNATVGNSEAAVRNRAALSGLVGNYQDLITKLAASGLSQKELADRTDEARKNFLSQATALGFSKRQLEPYSKAMSGFISIIKAVPRKVTVEMKTNLSAAENTLREFYAKLKLDNAAKAAEAAAKFQDNYVKGIQKAAQDARKKANDELSKIGSGIHPHIPDLSTPGLNNSAGLQQASLETLLWRYQQEERKKAAAGTFSDALDTEVKRITNALADHQFRFTGYSSGGYTGPGGVYEPAGIVHRGEYVVPKHLVNQQTGLPFADALGRLVQGTRGSMGYAGGGYVDPGVMVVEPGPIFKRELQKMVQTEVAAVIDPQVLAGASQNYRTQQRRRGSGR